MDLARVMFETATLRSGFVIRDSLDFAKRIERMMRMSMGVDLHAAVELPEEEDEEEKKEEPEEVKDEEEEEAKEDAKEAPAAETPAAETPAAETPATETPAGEDEVEGESTNETPAEGKDEL